MNYGICSANAISGLELLSLHFPVLRVFTFIYIALWRGYLLLNSTTPFLHCQPITFLLLVRWEIFRRSPFFTAISSALHIQDLLCYGHWITIIPIYSICKKSTSPQELLFCGKKSCMDTSWNTNILTPSNLGSIIFYPPYPHNVHFLLPSLIHITQLVTLYLECLLGIVLLENFAKEISQFYYRIL